MDRIRPLLLAKVFVFLDAGAVPALEEEEESATGEGVATSRNILDA